MDIISFESRGILYPLNIRKVELLDKNGKINADIRDYCPRCGYPTPIEPASEQVPVSKEQGKWRCRHCGARREWDLGKARRQIWNLYETWFLGINTFDDERAARLYANYAAALALGLAWIAPIRFVSLYTERIGHLALNTGIFWLLKQRGLYPPGLDIVGCTGRPVANQYLLDKWLAKIPTSNLLSYLPKEMVKILSLDPIDVARDCFNVIADADEPPLTFSEQENVRACMELEKMGVPPNAKIVALHCRDSLYLKIARPNVDSSYHNFRDVDIDTYRPACEYLVEQGYYVLRMGAMQEAPLAWANDKIIDYAFKYRSEFMDVWIFANCAFCMTMGSGPDAISIIQNRPMLYTNLLPHHQTISWIRQSITMYKDVFRKNEEQPIPIEELLDPDNPVGGFLRAEEYLDAGYRWVDNTPEEILTAAKDMHALLNGSLRLTMNEEKRQEQLWNRLKEARSKYAGQRLHPHNLKYHGLMALKYM